MQTERRVRSRVVSFVALLLAIALGVGAGSSVSDAAVECDPDAILYDGDGNALPVCGWTIYVNGEEVARGPFAIDADGHLSLGGESSVVEAGFTARIDGVSGLATSNSEIVFGVGATNNTNANAVFAFVFNLPLGGLEEPLTSFAELGMTLTAASDADATVSPAPGFATIVDSQDIRFNPLQNVDKGVDIGDPLTAVAGTTALRVQQANGSIDGGQGPYDLMNVTIAFELTDDSSTAGSGVGFSGRLTQTPSDGAPMPEGQLSSGWSIVANEAEVAKGDFILGTDGELSIEPQVVESSDFAASIDCTTTPDSELVFGLGATNNSNSVAFFAFAFNLPLGGLAEPLTSFAELGTTLTAPSDAAATVFPSLGVGKIVDSEDIRLDPFAKVDKGVDIGDPLTAAAGATVVRLEQATGSIDAGQGPYDLMAVTVAFGLTDNSPTAGSGVGFSGRVSQKSNGMVALPAAVDIKPGSCPNSYNRNSRGVLPVAIVGTPTLDVNDVELASVEICSVDGGGIVRQDCGADGTEECCIGPHEGPPGPHTVIADAATPFAGEACDCHEFEGDGIPDVSMKFKTEDLVQALDLDVLASGALVELAVRGNLLDGTPFMGTDCVRLVPPGTPPNMLQVSPSAAGAWIDVAPLDEQLEGGGFDLFQRTYPQDTEAVLTAEPEMNRRAFLGWRADGGRLIQTDSLTVRVNGHIQTVEAIYEDPPRRCGLGWELALLLTPLVWLHRRFRRVKA